MKSQLEECRCWQAAAFDEEETKRLRALADAGRIEEALAQQREAWERRHAAAFPMFARIEQSFFEEKKTAVILDAFHGRTFVGDTPDQQTVAAAMVLRLFQAEFETVRATSGSLLVRDKVSGQPAAEAIRERLDSPQFAVFFAPSSSRPVIEGDDRSV